MNTLMALLFLLAGILCINQPARIAAWMANALKRSGENQGAAERLKGRGVIFFIRLIGFLALINAVMLLFVASRT